MSTGGLQQGISLAAPKDAVFADGHPAPFPNGVVSHAGTSGVTAATWPIRPR
jgi:hypothetical protein